MENLNQVPEIEVKKRGRPPKENAVVKEEIKEQEYTVEIVRDWYGAIDPFMLSKTDPNFEYRFIRDEAKNINIKTSNLLFQKGGWQICPKEHLIRIGCKESEISADGLLRRGDQILAFMPKALYAEKLKYKHEATMAPTKNVKRLIDKGDTSVGGQDMHSTMRGIQTQKDLGM